jgi:hypothetical protein
MVRLKQSILMWPEFLQFCLEQLVFIVGDGFLVQNQNLRDVISVNLESVSITPEYEL